ncbi:MAG: hypothetical protein GY762_19040 [Proteobacteria bacterium]|nr:hypothetical protein [Pseudomonadota bacterium]
MFLFLDPISMIRDIRRQGLGIWIWGGMLNIPQLIGGLFFIRTIEGKAILVTIVLTPVVAGQIHKRTPFSRLIGMCHLPWLALLPWLVYRLTYFEHSLQLRIWMYYVATTILISLFFDALAVCRYMRGEKSFSWTR